MGRALCRRNQWGDIFRSTAVASLVLAASSGGAVEDVEDVEVVVEVVVEMVVEDATVEVDT